MSEHTRTSFSIPNGSISTDFLQDLCIELRQNQIPKWTIPADFLKDLSAICQNRPHFHCQLLLKQGSSEEQQNSGGEPSPLVTT